MKQPEYHVTAELTGIEPAWRAALDAAVAADPRGRQGVAERLNVTRAYVSRVVGGDLTAAPPARFIARVQAVLMQVPCPHLQRLIQPAECQAYAARTYAQINQFEVDHWRACRSCPAKAPMLPPARVQPQPKEPCHDAT